MHLLSFSKIEEEKWTIINLAVQFSPWDHHSKNIETVPKEQRRQLRLTVANQRPEKKNHFFLCAVWSFPIWMSSQRDIKHNYHCWVHLKKNHDTGNVRRLIYNEEHFYLATLEWAHGELMEELKANHHQRIVTHPCSVMQHTDDPSTQTNRMT